MVVGDGETREAKAADETAVDVGEKSMAKAEGPVKCHPILR